MIWSSDTAEILLQSGEHYGVITGAKIVPQSFVDKLLDQPMLRLEDMWYAVRGQALRLLSNKTGKNAPKEALPSGDYYSLVHMGIHAWNRAAGEEAYAYFVSAIELDRSNPLAPLCFRSLLRDFPDLAPRPIDADLDMLIYREYTSISEALMPPIIAFLESHMDECHWFPFLMALVLDLAGGDVERAVPYYEVASALGNARAQFTLALVCTKGTGVPKDDERALRLYRQAAEQNNPTALLNLGCAVSEGVGTPPDEREAERLWALAAKLGESSALYNMAYFCELRGDENGARENLRLAAERGYAPAQRRLGTMYVDGPTPELRVKGIDLLQKATRQGSRLALLSLGTVLFPFDEYQRDVRKIFQHLVCEHVEKKDPDEHVECAEDAQLNLGLCFETGCGGPSDRTKALSLYNLHPEHGFAQSGIRRLTA
jgi:TPR repeat protein